MFSRAFHVNGAKNRTIYTDNYTDNCEIKLTASKIEETSE